MTTPEGEPGRLLEAPATAVREGYRHEMGVYASDEQFGDLMCPFALDGLEAGEPVVFAYDLHKMGLLRTWLPDVAGISYVTDMGPYSTPARALAAWRGVVERHLAAGARRVRIAGDVPHPGYGRSYVGWDRYESALDRALGDLPVWAPCLYDTRIAPTEVLETAAKRHHHFLERWGTSRVNSAYDPGERLCDFLPPPPDSLVLSPPDFELIDPTPPAVRSAVAAVAAGVVDMGRRSEDLVLAASEAVVNALVHGRPPVTVRIWTASDRVVIDVHDEGAGPADPLAGLLPAKAPAESGRGLWLLHQLDVDVELVATGDGFTVRLRAGSGAAA